MAQQPLFFKKLSDHDRQTEIVRFLSFGGSVDAAQLTIADADLNGDGLDEYLIKAPNNAITVLALTPRRPAVELGRFESPGGLQVSDEDDFGVRRLIAHGTPTDDFAALSYRWNPWAQRYEKHQ